MSKLATMNYGDGNEYIKYVMNETKKCMDLHEVEQDKERRNHER